MSVVFRSHLNALGAGLAGAGMAAALGVPAGALVGASLAVAGIAAMGGAAAVDERLRQVAFTLIGISLGSTVPPGLLERVGGWGASLALLLLSLIATLWVGSWVLVRLFGHDRETALLSSVPGALSNNMALALEGRGDITTIMVLQTLRVLLLVICVPPIAALAGTPEGGGSGPGTMSLATLAALLAVGLAGGWAGRRMRLPAAALLSGMLVAAGAHLGGLAQGLAPGWAVFAGFTVTGAALGARFTAIGLAQLGRLSGEALVSVGLAVMVSAGFAALASWATGLPLGQVWIAFAPGAVEAMAAIGLALGYDPAYVATHHFARIAMLLVLAPLALRLVAGRGP